MRRLRLECSRLVGLLVSLGAAAALAQPSLEGFGASLRQADSGSRFIKLLPTRFDRDEVTVPVGEALKLAVAVERADGRALQLQVLGLPEGARFDPQLRALSWQPTAADVGSYPLRFVATDGAWEASRTLLLTVREDLPPTVAAPTFDARVGSTLSLVIEASDPEAAPLRFTADGLPTGAALDARTGRLTFTPGPAQVGVHRFTLHVSDGHGATSVQGAITVRPAAPDESEEWTSFLLPGVGYSLYAPRAGPESVLHGLTLEFVIVAWIHRNDERGPSHGRVYVDAELLSAAGAPLAFSYAAGISVSFESNPTRSWLIPHYGAEFGGLHYRGGAFFQATPYLGALLYADATVMVSARAGYRLVPTRIDELAGFQGGVVANVSFW